LKNKFGKISLLIISFGLILLSLSCGNTDSEKTENKNFSVSETPQKEVSTEKVETRETPKFVDVPNLANKSPAEFEKIFGKPVQITEIKDNPAMMPGEFRLYNVFGHPKGLSVRFFRGQAKRFNLLLGEPLKSSKDALLGVFKINVGEISPDKTSEPLSEKWKGKFNEIKFVTVYAKREKVTGEFTMVHAEVGE
jgi:hypothetical protein